VGTQATSAMTNSARSLSMTFALTNDTTAPGAGSELLASNATGDAYQASAGSAIFYNSTETGTLTISDAFTDTQSAPDTVTYPSLAANGWTHTNEVVSTNPSFTSSTFSWAIGATNPSLSLTQADSAGNTVADPVTLTPDGTAPTGGALT